MLVLFRREQIRDKLFSLFYVICFTQMHTSKHITEPNISGHLIWDDAHMNEKSSFKLNIHSNVKQLFIWTTHAFQWKLKSHRTQNTMKCVYSRNEMLASSLTTNNNACEALNTHFFWLIKSTNFERLSGWSVDFLCCFTYIWFFHFKVWNSSNA